MSDGIIRLNVGGRHFTTTRATLTKYKGSKLKLMFGASEESPLSDGSYFIDEDPDVFTAILAWIRHKVVLTNSVELSYLKATASVYGLEEMTRELDEFEKSLKSQNQCQDGVSDDIIRLNVGGRHITTTRATLTKYKGSMLELMFSEESPLPPAKLVDGAYFIDEDPDVFNAILAWIRHNVILTKSVELAYLKAAASYYGLEEMSNQLVGLESNSETPESGKDDVICLNVGGRIIPVLRSTINKRIDSKLARMFIPNHPWGQLPPPPFVNGGFVIDENPDRFNEYLDCFRYGTPSHLHAFTYEQMRTVDPFFKH